MTSPNKTKLEKLYKALANTDERTAYVLQSLEKEIRNLKTQVSGIKIPSPYKPDPRIPVIQEMLDEIVNREEPKIDLEPFNQKIKELEGKFVDIITTFQQNLVENPVLPEIPDVKPDIENLSTSIKKLRMEMLNKFANLGGGNANRNISISGNSSVLSRYTDINLKPGSNISLTYTNNDTTKNVDITIGDITGSGITRSIHKITVSSTVGAVASTDYVVLANGGIQVTLPTAVGNTNLYTIKNVAASSVLVATTGGQTIDGDTTIIMPVQYTAVDLISDNTNWQIT